jgi:Flp pilus assembly protein TadG
MTKFRSEEGQAAVMSALFLVVLIGMAGFVLDVGSWFREQRVAQSTVDAAALAGAQALPGDPSSANTLATGYADKNGGVAGATITITSTFTPNDTIRVAQAKPADGLFSKLFGFSTVTVHAHAAAASVVPLEAMYVAPIAVNLSNPNLSGPGCPCFNVPAVLPLGKTGAPGSFTMLNLNNDDTGTVGASELANWIQDGFNDYLPLRDYYSDPGAKWNNNSIQDALSARFGTDLLFPVYDTLLGVGSNAEYHVIGWVGFHITDAVALNGTTGSLTGSFTRFIAQGIVSTNGHPGVTIPDLGVHSVALID